MRRVKFDHVKPAARRHLGRRDELVAHPCPCRRGPSPWAPALPAAHGMARCATAPASCPSASGASPSSQPSCGRSLAPRMADLAADLRLRLGMDEIHQPLPRRLMLGRIKPRAAGRDPPLGRHAGHLGIDQPRPALGAFGVMHEMPVGRAAVHRLVLRHRRDDDAVLQRHVAQPERREHRRAARLARPPAPETSPRPAAAIPDRAGAGSRG